MKRFLFSFTFWTAVAGVCRAQTIPNPLLTAIDVSLRTPCNGSGDDTAIFLSTAASAAAVGYQLLVPYGKNCQLTSASLPAGTYLLVAGEIQLESNAGTLAPLLTAASFASNITLDGMGTGILDGNATGQTGTGTSGCVVFNGGHTINIKNFKSIQNCHNWPVNITTSAYDVHMSYLTATNNGNSLEYASGVHDCSADHININGTTDHGFAFYGGVYNCQLSYGKIYNSQASGVVILADSAQTAPAHDIQVSDIITEGNGGNAIETSGNLTGGTCPSTFHSDIQFSHIRGLDNGLSANNRGGAYIGCGNHISVTDLDEGPDGQVTFVGSIAPGNAASFTGTLSAGTLTVSSPTGTISAGEGLTGTGITAGTYITGGSGTTWSTNGTQTISSEAMTAASGIMTVTAFNSQQGQLYPGISQSVGGAINNLPPLIAGSGVTANTLLTGGPNAQTGTFTVDVSQTVASETLSASNQSGTDGVNIFGADTYTTLNDIKIRDPGVGTTSGLGVAFTSNTAQPSSATNTTINGLSVVDDQGTASTEYGLGGYGAIPSGGVGTAFVLTNSYFGSGIIGAPIFATLGTDSIYMPQRGNAPNYTASLNSNNGSYTMKQYQQVADFAGGTGTSFTLTLPVCYANENITILSSITLATLTVTPHSGNTIVNPPTSLVSGSNYPFTCIGTKWLPGTSP